MNSDEKYLTAFKLTNILTKDNYTNSACSIRKCETLLFDKNLLTKNILMTDSINNVKLLNYGG